MPNELMDQCNDLIEENKDKLPWCLAPFIGTAYMFNQVAPCCEAIKLDAKAYSSPPVSDAELFNNATLKNIRKAFMNNDYDALVPECKHCLNSSTSHSKFYTSVGNEHFIQSYLDNRDRFKEDGSVEKLPITYMSFAIDNKCNAACRMCYPIISNSKFELAKKADLLSQEGGIDTIMGFEDSFISTDMRQCVEVLKHHSDTLRDIVIQGGDPSQSKNLELIINTLLPYKDRIKIIFFTNGTFDTLPNGKLIWDLLAPFYKLNIRFSLDSIPEVNDYVRIGVKAKRLMTLYLRCKKYFDKDVNRIVGIHATVTNYTIYYIPDFLDWLGQYHAIDGSEFSINGVLRPSHTAPYNLPPELKKRVMEKLSAYKTESPLCKKIIKTAKSLLFQRPFDPADWNRCLWIDKKQDAVTGMTFPLFEPYKNDIIEITNWDKGSYY